MVRIGPLNDKCSSLVTAATREVPLRHTSKAYLWAGVAALGLMAAASQASAAAFYLQEQSVRAVGRAFSGEVADTGVQSLWWNPAAIGGMQSNGEAYVGVSGILVNSTAYDRGSTIQRPTLPPLPVGGDATQNDPVGNGALPSGGVAYKLGDQFAVGLMVSSPYSFKTEYDSTSFARYDALQTKLTTIDLQPTVAWSPSPFFTLGAGLNAEHSSATLTTALPNLSPLLPDGSERLHGSGWDYGWDAGVQVRPSERITLGLSYKSSIKHNVDGDVTIAGMLGPLSVANRNAPATADFRTPWMVTGGIRVKATDRLTLNAQVQRIGWSEFDQIKIILGPGAVIGEDYKDTTNFAVGFDYQLSPQLTFRGGVQRDPTPTPSTRDMRVPDADRWVFSVGGTFMANDNVGFDLAASYISFGDTRVNRTDVAFPGTPAQMPINTVAAINASAVVLAAGAHVSF
jgi:long-chain fatty acid transport protein